MSSWVERYEKYQKEIKECEKIKDVTEKAAALLRAEESFDLWMNIYPESKPWIETLEAQKKHDQFMDFLGQNPKFISYAPFCMHNTQTTTVVSNFLLPQQFPISP